MASEIRVNKINSQTGVGTITLSPTGVDISGITTVSTLKVGTGVTASEDGDIFFTGVCTATTFAGAHSGSGANLTSLPAAQLTGTLPAISGANLTGIAATDNVRTGILDVAGVSTFRNTMNVGAAVTISESGIEASGIGITVANINGTHVGGRRNKVINGAMTIAQGGTSDAMGNSENAYGTVDRFKITNLHDGAITASQSSTSPDGFSKSLKIDVTTADTSLTTSQRLHIIHYIEAQDLQDLGYGTSSAKEVRVSFYVRSNKTGNYTFALNQADNSFKNLSFQYAISSADTWERKSFVIPGDTAGVINNDNGIGIELYWWLAAGPTYTSGSLRSDWTTYSNGDFAAGQGVNLLDSTSNEWYLTGVQFEVGSQATPFEHRTSAQNYIECCRYYQEPINYTKGYLPILAGRGTGTSTVATCVPLVCNMRDEPSTTGSSMSTIYAYGYNSRPGSSGGAASIVSNYGHDPQGGNYAYFTQNGFGGSISDDRIWNIGGYGTGSKLVLDAEL